MAEPDLTAYDLARELGELLRVEREKRRLTQREFAERTGITQQRLSRVERGASALTTESAQRLFAALGLRLRVSVTPLEADLDAEIDRLIGTSDGDRLDFLDWHGLVTGALAEVPYVFTGRLAAFLQGAPVPASRYEIAIAESDVDSLDRVVGRLNCLRWDERWREYCNYLISPRRPGPMRWLCGVTELTVDVEPVPPAALTIEVGGRPLRVRPLAELEARDRELAAIMCRVRTRYPARGTAGAPEPV